MTDTNRGDAAWRSIDSAPVGVALFWVVPITSDDAHFIDTSGDPIFGGGPPRIAMCKYGQWSSLCKATHWMPLPSPPETASIDPGERGQPNKETP